MTLLEVSIVKPGLGTAGLAGGSFTVTELRAALSRCPSQAPGTSAIAIRSGLSLGLAIRSPPSEPRPPYPADRQLLPPSAVLLTAAWKCRAIGRARPASSLKSGLKRGFGLRLAGNLRVPIGRASGPASNCDRHQPHGRGLVLRGSRRLISPEESHQRCSRPKSHRHATYAYLSLQSFTKLKRENVCASWIRPGIP